MMKIDVLNIIRSTLNNLNNSFLPEIRDVKIMAVTVCSTTLSAQYQDQGQFCDIATRISNSTKYLSTERHNVTWTQQRRHAIALLQYL